ncbi:ABC transporter permease [Sneathiella chungangensis]|uniref:ABC transporter permease n=1 Tax=Sneathiella chungangensis TaxID=1418234 RepID=A0A845MG02_9PROT|nr:ABC transporter permease [Sneathiella chungangensis]MZR22908.1 ABC transporter permease [Sneathiella chungangensis]
MFRRISNIYRLGVKELYSVRSDPVLVFLLIWAFTFMVYEVAENAKIEVVNAAVGVLDEDQSALSRRIIDSILPPYFKPAEEIDGRDMDRLLDNGDYIFIIDIPPRFESDLLAGKRPEIQVNVDATAMAIAGNGSSYLASIINSEVSNYLDADGGESSLPVDLIVRVAFNPNVNSTWFMSVMAIINNVTLLAMILTGAALIREREHGTIEHLLVTPVTSVDIMISKVWSNGLIIIVVASVSLVMVVEGILQVPIFGSKPLFILGAVVYLFSVTSFGILLATLAGSMPQFGLLVVLTYIVMNLLSGSTTPLESMPEWLQFVMQFAPSTHYVSFSQSVLFRGAGINIVWPELFAMAGIGAAYFLAAFSRFRKVLDSSSG